MVSVCVFQLAELDHEIACKDIQIGEQRREMEMQEENIQMVETQLEIELERSKNMDAALPMPENPQEVENLEIWADPAKKLISPSRRCPKTMKKRANELTASGFHRVHKLTKMPNSKYLWKNLKSFMSKQGTLTYRPVVNAVTNKNLCAYYVSDKIDVQGVIRGWKLTEGEQWLAEIITAAGRVWTERAGQEPDQHLVTITLPQPVVRPQ